MLDYEKLYPAVLATMFPDLILRRQVAAILERYGDDGFDKEPKRVYLAILKLAGRDLEAIEIYVGYALTDYRDVMAWAEYPQAIRTHSWRLPDGSPEKELLNNADLRQYQEWINSILSSEEGKHGQKS